MSAILAAHRSDQQAFRQLVPLLYDELRALAHRRLRSQRPGPTLDTTELVHETFVKLARSGGVAVNDRGHFFSLAAQAMRQILMDLARRAHTAKRGRGQEDESLDDQAVAVDAQIERWLDVDCALKQLGEIDERLVRVVECRFFAELTDEETAATLGVTARTVQRDWKRARMWLRELLASPCEAGA